MGGDRALQARGQNGECSDDSTTPHLDSVARRAAAASTDLQLMDELRKFTSLPGSMRCVTAS